MPTLQVEDDAFEGVFVSGASIVGIRDGCLDDISGSVNASTADSRTSRAAIHHRRRCDPKCSGRPNWIPMILPWGQARAVFFERVRGTGARSPRTTERFGSSLRPGIRNDDRQRRRTRRRTREGPDMCKFGRYNIGSSRPSRRRNSAPCSDRRSISLTVPRLPGKTG